MNAETLKDRPRIMYVCEVCAEGCPEACGHYDADEIRQAPGGEWLCVYCYDEYEHEDCETAPMFSDLPAAPQLAADNIALKAEVERMREALERIAETNPPSDEWNGPLGIRAIRQAARAVLNKS